jgi:hypothetical protein
MGNVTAKAEGLTMKSSSKTRPAALRHKGFLYIEVFIGSFLFPEGNKTCFLPDCRVSGSKSLKT